MDASPPLDALAVDAARQRVAIAAVPDVADVVAGMRALGAELHQAAASVSDNWTVSPLSIDVAFGMLRAGARGRTARQIDEVFGFARPGSSGSPHAALNALAGDLVTTAEVRTAPSAPSGEIAPGPVVAVANGLFLDRSYIARVGREFLHTLATHYGTSPWAVSFSDPAAAADINAWVSRHTRERITKLFDTIDPSTVLVLASAVYLKATWMHQFSERMTSEGPFTTAAGQRVTAQLMRQRFHAVRYGVGDAWQRVSLPYVGNELVMRVVVPTGHAASVAALAPALAAATQPVLGDSAAWVDLTLPRWDTATTLPLVAALSSVGLSEVFTARADLSAIAPELFVSDAIHRANITVDEQGTEAAAVTAIAVVSSMMAGSPIVLRADRPFAWAVVHEPTGTPVFTGHVTNPAAPGPR